MGSENPPENIYDICRLCSSHEGNKLPILGDDDGDQEPLSHRIRTCVSVSVCIDDNLSTQICEPCYDLVTRWYQFREECSLAQEKQKKWLRLAMGSAHPGGSVIVKAEPVYIEELDEDDVEEDYSIDIKQEVLDITDVESVLDLSVPSPRESSRVPVPPRLISAMPPLVRLKREHAEHSAMVLSTNSDRGSASNNGYMSDNDIEEVILEEIPKKQHKCKVCDKLLASRGGLTRHKHNHIKNSFKCSQCTKQCLSAIALTEHMKTEHKSNINKYSCVKCKKVCRGEEKLKRHMVRCHFGMIQSLAVPTCSVCSKTFTNQTNLNVHMISHTATCGICEDIFPDSSRLASHMRSHHSGGEDVKPFKKRYRCKRCSLVFPHWYQLKKHQLVHETNQIPLITETAGSAAVYKCGQCTRVFSIWKEFTDHQQSHAEPSIASSSSTGHNSLRNSTYSCNSCQVTFPRHRALEQHRESVHSGRELTDIKPSTSVINPKAEPRASDETNSQLHSCHICFKKFLYSSLARHILSHSTEKRYACPICHIRMKYQYSVQKHLMTKHGVQYELSQIKPDVEELRKPLDVTISNEVRRNVVCQMCNKCFSSEEAMHTHQQVKHKDVQSTKCRFCSQMYRRAEDLARHESSHMKTEPREGLLERPYKCEVCHLSYPTAKGRQEHQRRKNHYNNMMEIKIKIFSCTSCHNSYNNEEALRIHRQKKHGIGNEPNSSVEMNTCHVCKRDFANQIALNRHVRRMHSYVDYKQECLKFETDFTCPTCGKSFDKLSALTAHRGWHARSVNSSPLLTVDVPVGSKKQRVCHICSKEFLTHTAFKIHFNFHKRALDKTANISNLKLVGTSASLDLSNVTLTNTDEIPNGQPSKKHEGVPSTRKLSIQTGPTEFQKNNENDNQLENGPDAGPVLTTNMSEVTDHNETEEASCLQCNMKFPSSRSLGAHVIWHKRSRKVPKKVPQDCIYCNKKFYRPGNLKNHLHVCSKRINDDPTVEGSATVSEVNGKTDDGSEKQQSVSVSTSQSLVSKFTPSRSKPVDNTYKKRRRRHKGSFTCDVCSKVFTMYRSMVTHKIWHGRHAKDLAKSGGPTADKQEPTADESVPNKQIATTSHRCDFCPESFVSIETFRTHRNLHLRKLARSGPKTASGDTVFTCRVCPETFDNSSKLNRHRQKHIREIFPVQPGKVGRRSRRKRCPKPPVDAPVLDAADTNGPIAEIESFAPELSPAYEPPATPEPTP